MPREPVPFDVISARIAARQEAGRRHREVMYERYKAKARTYARAHLRTQREAEDIALIRRYEALKAARAEARRSLSPLAELVAEQERDERQRTIGARWMLSLDAEREGRGEDARGKWTLYDVIAANE